MLENNNITSVFIGDSPKKNASKCFKCLKKNINPTILNKCYYCDRTLHKACTKINYKEAGFICSSCWDEYFDGGCYACPCCSASF